MPLIPVDIGLRLRLDNELVPQQATPARVVAADLRRLQTGQVFTAQIRDVLPENACVALVGGSAVMLSLPQPVRRGDILDLVVIDRTPGAIVAQLAGRPAGAHPGTATAPQATLSPTAQFLGTLLRSEGEAPRPAPLNGGRPLLSKPPVSGAELAPALRKAASESGLFYEAHQARWVAGKFPLVNLRQEPQAQQPPSKPASAPALVRAALAGSLPSDGALPDLSPGLVAGTDDGALAGSSGQPDRYARLAAAPASSKAALRGILQYQASEAQEASSPTPHALPAQAAGEQGASGSGTTTTATVVPATTSADTIREAALDAAWSTSADQTVPQQPSIPDALRPLVQQQLDAAAAQRLLWQGEVWPGQTMQWQVEWEGAGNDTPEADARWATTLRLTTPRLGAIQASLKLDAGGIRISLTAPEGKSAADLRAGAGELELALAAAGVPLCGFSVRSDQET